MGASKWDKVKDKLPLIEAWCRDGLIETDICKRLGISVMTLNRYKQDHSELCESLKRGKEVVDYEVEQKLLKRAMGYLYTEKKTTTNPDGTSYVTETVKEVVADTTAQIFWLKNRKPKEWRDKQEIEHSGETTVNNKIDLTGFTTEQLKEMLKE